MVGGVPDWVAPKPKPPRPPAAPPVAPAVSAPAVEVQPPKKKAPKRKRPTRDPAAPLRRSKRDPTKASEEKLSTCQGQDTAEALARALDEAASARRRQGPADRKTWPKARRKYYDRPERVRVEAARVAAQNAARKGGRVDRNERHGIGVTVALCDWERATADLETILETTVSEDFEKRRDLAHFEAGHEAMRTFATKALGDALHQPVARTAHKPHILHEPLRSYETLSTYVPFPGADEREIQTAQRLLKVSTEPGLGRGCLRR